MNNSSPASQTELETLVKTFATIRQHAYHIRNPDFATAFLDICEDVEQCRLPSDIEWVREHLAILKHIVIADALATAFGCHIDGGAS